MENKIKLSLGEIELSCKEYKKDKLLQAFVIKSACEKLFAEWLTKNLTSEEIKNFFERKTSRIVIPSKTDNFDVELTYKWIKAR